MPNQAGRRKSERDILREFICEYKKYPELWDAHNEHYKSKDKKRAAYGQLLIIYRELKHNATVEDVKKKINIIRCNYRKELKKIKDSQEGDSIKSNEEYQPTTSWLFSELQFLRKLEKPVKKVSPINREACSSICEMHTTENKKCLSELFADHKLANSVTQQELCALASNYLPKEEEDANMVKVWVNKIKSLTLDQKIYAEKAINDILFEAQLGNLRRNSVKINEPYVPSGISYDTNNWNDTHLNLNTNHQFENSYVPNMTNSQTPLQNYISNFQTNGYT